MKRRARTPSKLWVTATTGGWLPICFIIIASASNSASSPPSTSIMRMVAPVKSLLLRADGFDLTMLSPICPERTERSADGFLERRVGGQDNNK